LIEDESKDEDLWYDAIEGESDDTYYEGNSSPASEYLPCFRIQR